MLTARARALLAELLRVASAGAMPSTSPQSRSHEWPAAGADADRAPLVLIRQRALLALGDTDAARALLDRTRDVPADASDQSRHGRRRDRDGRMVGA